MRRELRETAKLYSRKLGGLLLIRFTSEQLGKEKRGSPFCIFALRCLVYKFTPLTSPPAASISFPQTWYHSHCRAYEA